MTTQQKFIMPRSLQGSWPVIFRHPQIKVTLVEDQDQTVLEAKIIVNWRGLCSKMARQTIIQPI